MTKMKCKCGVELFDKDIVDKTIEWDGRGCKDKSFTYRCPKCFKTKTVKSKMEFCD